MRRLTIAFASMFVLLLRFTVSASAQDIDCPGLSFEEAQAILAQDSNDPNGLDRDNDGVACENNARDGGSQSGDSDDAETTALPSTGSGPMADTTGASASLFGALAALLAVGGFTLRRAGFGRF
jgi:hypothetical protein